MRGVFTGACAVVGNATDHRHRYILVYTHLWYIKTVSSAGVVLHFGGVFVYSMCVVVENANDGSSFVKEQLISGGLYTYYVIVFPLIHALIYALKVQVNIG